jgi:hypothetical protein
MRLEEAVVRALQFVDEDPSLLLVLPLVLVKNEEQLDVGDLLARAHAEGLGAELGMFLDLTATPSGCERFHDLAARLTPREGQPRYYPAPLGGKRGRALADERTPAVVRRWDFRMNATEDDLRQFLQKHIAPAPERRAQ